MCPQTKKGFPSSSAILPLTIHTNTHLISCTQVHDQICKAAHNWQERDKHAQIQVSHYRSLIMNSDMLTSTARVRKTTKHFQPSGYTLYLRVSHTQAPSTQSPCDHRHGSQVEFIGLNLSLIFFSF